LLKIGLIRFHGECKKLFSEASSSRNIGGMTIRGSGISRSSSLSAWGPVILVLAAIFYYGLYWRSGLMLSGEEGVAAVVAQRLNAGALPIVDTFLGYNVGWFYPIAWLFKAVAPDYLLLRAYFFLLGILSGLAAYTTVVLATRRTVPALFAGVIVILMPGVIGRNSMGLLGLLGMLTILGTFILPHRRKIHGFLWMVASGISISLAWLVRIDIGFFQTVLFFLTAVLFLIRPEPGFFRRLAGAVGAVSILIVSFVAIQGPVYSDAVHRGFGRQFTEQYWVWPSMIRNGADQLLKQALAKPPQPSPSTQSRSMQPPDSSTSTSQDKVREHGEVKESAVTSEPAHSSSASYSDASLKRPPLAALLKEPTFKERLFVLLIYLPLPVALLFVIWGGFLILRSVVTRDLLLWNKGGILLVSTGSALVLFPQYFFWRPDMVHLGELMVPFMVTLVMGIFLAVSEWRRSGRGARLGLLLLILAASLDLSCYIVKGWQTGGSGSIASARRRHLEFRAANGVRVKLNSQELSRDMLLRDTILANSKPGEYVVCYPYFPMVNFMTDRPSYEYNLYADNALPKEQFFTEAKANILRFHPAVIVIGTGRINDTESSRFQNWASDTYGYIREHFRLVASDNEVEIYAR
jgi:hypothetical protein